MKGTHGIDRTTKAKLEYCSSDNSDGSATEGGRPRVRTEAGQEENWLRQQFEPFVSTYTNPDDDLDSVCSVVLNNALETPLAFADRGRLSTRLVQSSNKSELRGAATPGIAALQDAECACRMIDS